MKALLSLLIITLCIPAFSQVSEVPFIGVQYANSPYKSPYSEISFTAGLRRPNYGEIGIGPTIRYITASNIGHGRASVGISGFLQLDLFHPLLMSFKTDILWGRSYERNHINDNGTYSHEGRLEVTTRELIFFTSSLGFPLNENAVVSAGFSPFTYDPKKFTEKEKRPFSFRGRVVLSVKYSFITTSL